MMEERSRIERAFVIGLGEVGRRLARALRSAGWPVVEVTRSDGWVEAADPARHGWRIVAVREEDLAGVLERMPSALRDRCVLVQNGFLEAVLGDLGPVSRALIYFTSKGDFFRVLCASPLHGGAAVALGPALESAGIPIERIDDGERFVRAMIVKGIWNGVVGLPLAVHGIDLAGYLSERADELEALVAESARAAGAHYGVDVEPATALSKIRETTRELGWVRGGAKALAWRNGAVAAFGRRHGVPTPVNDRLLRAVGYDPDRPPAG